MMIQRYKDFNHADCVHYAQEEGDPFPSCPPQKNKKTKNKTALQVSLEKGMFILNFFLFTYHIMDTCQLLIGFRYKNARYVGLSRGAT